MQDTDPWIKIKHSSFKSYLAAQMPYIVLIATLLVFGVVFFFDNIVISIYPGQIGVLWQRFGNGTVIDRTFKEGVHFVLPINKMYIYNVRRHEFRDSIQALTKDGLTLVVQYSVRYYLKSETLPQLHQSVGEEYAKILIRPEIKSVMRTIFGQYRPEEIYNAQKMIQERVSQLSKVRLQANFVSLDGVPIENITLPEAISKAIEDKMTHQQFEGGYAYRIRVAEKEAKRKKIEADGLARYNKILDTSLTPSIIKWYGVQATEAIANSPNSKTVIIGAGKNGLPVILGKD
jgi:regulator of protease activity HflC (stomatin/prohibitin superfamily)